MMRVAKKKILFAAIGGLAAVYSGRSAYSGLQFALQFALEMGRPGSGGIGAVSAGLLAPGFELVLLFITTGWLVWLATAQTRARLRRWIRVGYGLATVGQVVAPIPLLLATNDIGLSLWLWPAFMALQCGAAIAATVCLLREREASN